MEANEQIDTIDRRTENLTTPVGKVKDVGTIFKWVIKDFSSIHTQIGTLLNSPIFTMDHSKSGRTLQWRLLFYPKGYNIEVANCLTIMLQNLSGIEVEAMFSISLIDNNDIEIYSRKTTIRKLMKHEASSGWRNYWKRVFLLDGNRMELLNDTLTLRCCIYSLDIGGNCITKMIYEDDDKKMRRHFDKLFRTGKFSDVTVVVRNRRYKLHKVVLGSQCQLFSNIFCGHDPQKTKTVKINTTIRYRVMKEVFRYVYTRKVKNIQHIVTDLYLASYTFNIIGLKELCIKALCTDINRTNSMHRLKFALQYNLTDVTTAVTEFIVKRFDEACEKRQIILSPEEQNNFLKIIGDQIEKNLSTM